MFRFRIVVAACLLAVGWPSLSAMSQSDVGPLSQTADGRLDVTPIRDLLHLINTIAEENPDCAATIARFAKLDGQAYQDSCAQYIRHNADNARIANEVDALLASPAYQLYYLQFPRSASQEAHRKVFFSLPYLAADAPGGIGANLLELSHHSLEVESMLETVVTRINSDSCLAIARRWLPAEEYTIPKTYVIYDGMETGFAIDGAVCYDLYAGVMGKRPFASRFDDLSDIEIDHVTHVLAHEYHHIYSERLLAASAVPEWTWQRRWKYKLDSLLIYEGAAMQCDPRTGMEREVRQDTTVIRFWVDVLNRTVTGLRDRRITEPQIQSWWDGDSDRARGLLASFLQRRFPNGNQDSLLACHMSCRPGFGHTLGWWMVSQIADDGMHLDKVVQLLSNPDSLYSWYNAAIGTADSTLMVTAK